MYAVSYKYEDVKDTAAMSDETEIKAVFHAGIALGIQYLECTDAGALLNLLIPDAIDKVLNDLTELVRNGEISVSQI